MLVCSSVIRQLEIEKVTRVDFGEIVKQDIDNALVRGSTYLHNNFDFFAANKTLDSIDSSTAIIGLGAQNPTKDVKFLDDNVEARNFIARLSEKGKSISVRGNFTAAVVERLGGKDIRVTGCPSLFYNLSCPSISLSPMLSRPERSIGISLHTGLTQNIFCHDPKSARLMHGLSISWALRNASNIALFEQGVPHEYDIADRTLSFNERLEKANAVLKVIGNYGLLTPYDLLSRMVSVKSIEEWLAKARDLDAIIGFRFHGNMVALLQGYPAYYYTYDSRLVEFCEIYRLPCQDVCHEFIDPSFQIINHDWDVTNSSINKCYSEIKYFYEENGFKHKLI